MNVNKSIISLAVLEMNWERKKRDYLDGFVPFVAECIRLAEDDIVSAPVIKEKLSSAFGLEIPLNVIDEMLPRVKNEGYIRADNKAYYRDLTKLGELKLNTIKSEVLKKHDSLIQHLIKFCKEKFDQDWDISRSESVLYSYLEDEQVNILKAISYGNLIPPASYSSQNAKYIVASFVQYLQENHFGDLEYFETIVKGNMLATGIYLLPDPGQASRKFNNTEIFFDTSFLIYALGYSGPELQAPSAELLVMLREVGAALLCFRHTRDEIQGIFEWYGNQVLQGRPVTSPQYDYFQSKNFTSTDMDRFSINLESDLRRLGIKVVDTPSHTEPIDGIDEEALEEVLEAEIKYKRDDARRRDVDSLSAIKRLRQNHRSQHVEDCRALFVTPNKSVIRAAHKFFTKESVSNAIPICWSDSALTCLLWLKRPLKASGLPHKMLIANSISATQPGEQQWQQFVVSLEKYESEGVITSDQAVVLRYKQGIKALLMEATVGGEKPITQGTVQALLEQIQAKELQEAKQKLNLAEQQRAEIEAKEKRYAQKKLSVRHRRANKIAKMVLFFITPLALLSVMLASYFSLPGNQPIINSPILKGVVFFLVFLAATLSIVDLWLGISIKELLKRIEVWLTQRFEMMLLHFDNHYEGREEKILKETDTEE